MPSGGLKEPQPVRYGVESGLKMLMYCRVHCASETVFALSHNRLSLFQLAASKPLTWLVALMLLVAMTSGVARAEEPLRDPTRPYTAAERVRTAAPRYVVHAIIVSAERRVAIVNGRRVAVGGSIAGATVVAIEKDQLILDLGGKRITAALNDGASR